MKTIKERIINNERYEAVLKVYEHIKEKYGQNIIIAGGCLVDCYYNKAFYDIDCFIYINDLKEEHRSSINTALKDRIIDVIRDEYEGYDLDIVVLGIPVEEHVKHFDICQKMIHLDKEGVHVHPKAANDINTNIVSLNAMTNDFHLFRLIRAADKYEMKIDPFDSYILNEFLSYALNNRCKLYISKKYETYLQEYIAYTDCDERIYNMVRNAIRNNIYKGLENTIYNKDLKIQIANLY